MSLKNVRYTTYNCPTAIQEHFQTIPRRRLPSTSYLNLLPTVYHSFPKINRFIPIIFIKI